MKFRKKSSRESPRFEEMMSELISAVIGTVVPCRTDPNSIDGVLVQWGDRLFYPGNRIVKAREQPRLGARSRAAAIRQRIAATVRRAPQVMVIGADRKLTHLQR